METASHTSVEKAIDVLFHLGGQPAPVGVSELGRALGLPKSSTHRLLAALVRRGLVRRDERGRYAPGLALLALGLGALDREPLVAAAREVLVVEAAATGETVFLVAARGGRLVVLDKAEGTGFLRAAPRVGQEVPVHATAVGKLFCAFGDAAPEPGPLERFTPQTPATGRAFARAVARARREGFARSREEWMAGLSVLAAPVLARGRLEGALALAAPSARLAARDEADLERRLRAAAARVGALLEGDPRG